ncbi:DNA internalization-related competence protein ComEC/Rec2 [Halomonas stenophila]|uniref:Competence protein ComEC n=1 Tax=Halomonas stenophila TaxID=795312 RepID=A0A7W5EVR6_9GAMM|nr:DNA internalization-related competence protein ComEC/Rec2 [Halomonas stenophila]MBB3231601.1 competence protein ComEC [Halomonas stenophila]
MAPIRDDAMRCGLAMPLACAALGGGLTGHLASTALLQALGLALLGLAAGRRAREALLVLVMLTVAAQLLVVRGGELAPGLSRQELRLEGRLLAASREARQWRLDLAVSDCRPLATGLPACSGLSRVRLSAFAGTLPPGSAFRAGATWRLVVRLRPPSGFANPGAFDYRAWLWREGIQATGYVRQDPPPRRLAPASPSWRQRALTWLDDHDLPARPARWLAALTLGASQRLEAADWDLLNASGTTHLMVISGLHVGLVAGFALWLGRALAWCLAPSGWRMAVWPWWLAAAAAVGYAGLAGLEPPALRAMIMTLLGLWVASGRHAPGPWQAWWLALGLVVGFDPLSIWRPGLWLSFAAVALLILVWQGRARPRGWRGWLWALGRTQLLLAPLMAAAVLLAFGRLAPAGPLVNLFAVPLVGSLMVPLGLAGWLLAWVPPLGDACWWLFAKLAAGLAMALSWAVELLPLWHPPAAWILPLALGLGLLSLLWALPGLDRRLRLVGSGLLATLPLWLVTPLPAPGTLWVRIHDVGQGQLVSLRTAGYRALVDTGPRFGSGFMPLSSLWPPGQHFDDVIIGHSDRDHAGGLPGLIADHRVDRYLAPVGHPHPVATTPCTAGRRWRRDGVAFRVLWPPEAVAGLSDNDRSCVLLVTAGPHRLLITGDAGRRVERSLLPALDGPVTVLVAGHHGSRTSSGAGFVRRVSPRQVIFSAARDNPFGHPDPVVVRRFRRAGSCLWNTARDGAVTLHLGRREGLVVGAERPPTGHRGGVGGGCLAVESPPSMPEIRR